MAAREKFAEAQPCGPVVPMKTGKPVGPESSFILMSRWRSSRPKLIGEFIEQYNQQKEDS